MTATNFLYSNADKDGSVMGLVQNNTPFEPLFGTKEARYDLTNSIGWARPAPRLPWFSCGTRCR
jgi:hypothetical protein